MATETPSRRIEFRALDTKTGKWAFGDLVHGKDDPAVVTVIDSEGEGHACDASTVGQYTGVDDAAGTPLYEGDVISDGKSSHAIYFEPKYSAFYLKLLDGDKQPTDVTCGLYPDWIRAFGKKRSGTVHDKKRPKKKQKEQL